MLQCESSLFSPSWDCSPSCDGSLGMGYGATSSSLLVLVGLTPLAASASMHFSELGTNLASGVSHWRLRNVDWPVVARIAGPGAVGAFLGATVLATLSTTWVSSRSRPPTYSVWPSVA
jgi:uncharacterized membrane protein YfcA